jgi:peroxiredoxin Q/BCP
MTSELKAGDPAPGFALTDGDGKQWRLSDLRGTRVVLYFYPADNTPGCTAESCDFRDNYSAFKGANVEILGVSPQGAASHQRFATKYSLPFPLLIDKDLAVASSYGAVKDRPEEWEGIPIKIKRSTFVIGHDGTIEQAIYGVKVKGHVESLKESLAS